eukprot:Gb_09337 [translate_table: standard]
MELVSMSKFTSQEVSSLQGKRYTGDRVGDKLPRKKMGDRDDTYENRRYESYQSDSRSPPYEDQYGNHCYGERPGCSARKVEFDRGHYDDKGYDNRPLRKEVLSEGVNALSFTVQHTISSSFNGGSLDLSPVFECRNLLPTPADGCLSKEFERLACIGGVLCRFGILFMLEKGNRLGFVSHWWHLCQRHLLMSDVREVASLSERFFMGTLVGEVPWFMLEKCHSSCRRNPVGDARGQRTVVACQTHCISVLKFGKKMDFI